MEFSYYCITRRYTGGYKQVYSFLEFRGNRGAWGFLVYRRDAEGAENGDSRGFGQETLAQQWGGEGGLCRRRIYPVY